MQFEEDVIDKQSEIYYEIRTSFSNVNFPHKHDYYEISFLMDGAFLYNYGDRQYYAETGTLMLARPFDVHEKVEIKPFKLFQIAFPQKTFRDMVQYLGEDLNLEELVQRPDFVIQTLTVEQQRYVASRFEDLINTDYQDKALTRAKLRILLVALLTEYFFRMNSRREFRDNIEPWLKKALYAMQCKENFTEGLAAMLRISGCTHEHLCRVMKQHLGTTPTAYINALRMGYAESLLLHTDMEILDICYESGFNNLGYFYRVFKEKNQVSPKKFRAVYEKQKNLELVSHIVAKEVVEKPAG